MISIYAANNMSTLSQCLDIRRRVFVVERNISEEIERDEYDVIGGVCDHFLIMDGRRVVGAFRCMRRNAVVILQRLCVLRDERGKGTGAGALALMEEHYRESGFLRIELDAKCESREFYEKQGYIVVSGVFEEAGVPHVRMLKEL